MLGRTMHGLAYDAAHDEIFVPQPFAQSILVFRGAVSGEEAPIRFVQGPLTRIDNPDKLEVDPVHDELYVPQGEEILVFPRGASGNVAPIRVMKMPAGYLVDAVTVDYVHNVVITTDRNVGNGKADRSAAPKLPRVMIFNRTDEGNVKPKGVIGGPKSLITGTFGVRALSQSGLLLLAMNGPRTVGPTDEAFVGVWSINDNGDVPPRWMIGGPYGLLKQPRGVDLDIKNKSVIVTDKVTNSVLTYHFPEIF